MPSFTDVFINIHHKSEAVWLKLFGSSFSGSVLSTESAHSDAKAEGAQSDTKAKGAQSDTKANSDAKETWCTYSAARAVQRFKGKRGQEKNSGKPAPPGPRASGPGGRAGRGVDQPV